MQKILIDNFTVPEESKPPFLEATRKVQNVLKTLPGFVEGYLHEKRDGDSPFNFVTTAVWENEAAFLNAKKLLAAEFQRLKFFPQEVMKKLKVEIVRATYERAPY